MNNAHFYEGTNLIDYLRDIGIHFRLNTMLSREMVSSRLQQEEGLSFT